MIANQTTYPCVTMEDMMSSRTFLNSASKTYRRFTTTYGKKKLSLRIMISTAPIRKIKDILYSKNFVRKSR